MKLYLVQHAESKSKEDDPERNLSDMGIANITKTAAYVSDNIDILPECIYHSGKARALQTAEILAKKLKPNKDIIETDGLKPNDDPGLWIEKLAQYEDDILLVGHLPHLEKLAALLLCGVSEKKIIKFHNTGIVCLERSESSEWSVNWVITPDFFK